MLTKLKKLKAERSDQGFTIIEVMIVLAIAGLILLIVFLAVPALQRNARNTTLKSDASAVAAGITEYVSNNNGSQPTTISQLAATPSNITVGAAGTSQASAKVNGSTVVSVAPGMITGGVGGNIGNGTVKVYLGHDCSGAANTRESAVFFGVEVTGTTNAGCIQT
jgi:prepilin-type N-terminal cleavage/methylation domain-containing protein